MGVAAIAQSESSSLWNRTSKKGKPTASIQRPDAVEGIDIVSTFERVNSDEILHHFLKSSLAKDFFDLTKPWVLVPNGSFLNYFDWVPIRFRVGPWHPACIAYLCFLTGLVAYECFRGFADESIQHNWTSAPLLSAWTWTWHGNVAGFAWTSWIVYKIFQSGMGWTSWGMYTVWSWTFIMLRYGLCAALPFKPEWAQLNEQIRFPMLVQATLTFGIWNAVISPSIYAQMKTSAMKESFVRFFGNFLWKQLHVFNILWAAWNGVWGSPARPLTKADFAVAMAICLLYAYFYLLILDRVGVHYYLVFSPRSKLPLISWTMLFGCYYACFPLWDAILTKYA